MNNLIVIECIEDGSIESDIIGVASDMEKAKEMMWEYFGDKLIVYNIEDIRDSGIEYIFLIYCDDESYKIIFRDYELNHI